MAYLPHTAQSREEMLNRIGVESIEELFIDIPDKVRLKRPLNISEGMVEQDLVKYVKELSSRNGTVQEYLSFLGAGAYEHFIPSYVNQLLLRSEFYTAYTPYQPEISQGTLQAIYEFQTLVCELTGMDAANASMYDGATAAAEAAIMSCDAARRDKIVVLNTTHPEYREVLLTYLKPRGIKLVTIPNNDGLTNMTILEQELKDAAGVVIQYPNFFGCLEEVKTIAELAHNNKALLIAITNPMTLGLLEAPGQLGADIVCGEGQPFGNPLNYGGPYVGFLAAKEKFVRRLPGRIVGLTTDTQGRRGFVLTLQAREQHIRREKATSNICSNEALCALAFTMHLSGLGKTGLHQLGVINFQNAHYTAGELAKLPGVELAFKAPFFHEFVLKVPISPAILNEKLLAKGIIGGLDLSQFYPELDYHMLFCVTETKSKQDIDRLVAEMGAILNV